MKKSTTKLITGIAVACVFVLAAVMFVLVQYEYQLGLTLRYNGFQMAFGADNYDGNFLFFLPFFFAIVAAICAVLGILKVVKVNGTVMYGICAGLALISAVLYIVVYFWVLDKYGRGELFDMSKNVSMMFSFWFGLVLHIIACVASGYAIIVNKK